MNTLEEQLAAYGEQRREGRIATSEELDGRSLAGASVHVVDATPEAPQLARRVLPIWVAGVAVAAATLLGFGLISWFTGSGTPSDGPRTPAAPETTPTTLAVGRHSITVDGFSLSFDLRALGWESHGDFLMTRDFQGQGEGAEAVIYFATFPEGSDAVRCPDLPFGQVPEDADIDALARSVSSRVDNYTVGGLQARNVGVQLGNEPVHPPSGAVYAPDVGCDPGYLYSWPVQSGGASWTESKAHDFVDAWFVDVEGTVLVVVAETRGLTVRRALGGEIYRIIDSIRFELPIRTASADYIIDLDTGEKTLLPAAIRSQAPSQYSVSPDGSMVAYVAPDSDGSFQLFTAGIDGADIRQATHPPAEASWPAWSPDGSLVAYEESGGLFVLDVATGQSTQVLDAHSGFGTQFTPDGSSILYGDDGQLWTVPIGGGSSTLLVGREQGVEGGGGSLSPDGSLVTFMGNRINGPGAIRFLAATDGSDPRELDNGDCRWSGSSGTWSPDGTRIVCPSSDGILVVEVATGEASIVAAGKAAIWLDDHTLLVEAWGE